MHVNLPVNMKNKQWSTNRIVVHQDTKYQTQHEINRTTKAMAYAELFARIMPEIKKHNKIYFRSASAAEMNVWVDFFKKIDVEMWADPSIHDEKDNSRKAWVDK